MMNYENETLSVNRRNFIKGAAAGWILLNSSASFAFNRNFQQKKLVWIFLRGALDGLHAVVPVADPYLQQHRKGLIEPIQSQLHTLNSQFGLAKDLAFMHQLYQQKQMSPVVAVASGYRQRSHFDAQDQMESGLNQTDHDNGWLARALKEINGGGLAISRSIPIAFRDGLTNSGVDVDTWFPSSFPEAPEDLLNRLNDMYAKDPALNSHLQAVIEQKQNPSMMMQEKRPTGFDYLAKQCAHLLANSSANCAMLELNGWDTHNNQVRRLSRNLSLLDKGIQNLQLGMGQKWQDTLVIVSTEFGRTVAVNGTMGTDHGTASSMFLAGGALATFNGELSGGKVLGDWPGLAPEKLYQGRDLMATSDVRYWYAKALQSHWKLNRQQLSRIFPDLPL
ncbi:DUF1501 domain-containing protein [Aliiglaciecola sp. NS0011-25]|uniref:DUF1501 domain-containing protein n=1 Tax=Aliiglaciecola sp. NS0011-25 TaxID=3127654 RepID=UPI003108A848